MNKLNVVFSCSEEYILQLTITIKSIVETLGDVNCNIFILNGGISEEKQIYVKKKFSGVEKINIKFVYFYNFIEKDIYMYTNSHFTVETYFRLFLPYILNVNKVLYLDADIIVKENIEELYNIELGTNILGAVKDIESIGCYNSNKYYKNYIDKTLKLSKPNRYFQAGVLLINCDEYRKMFNINFIKKVISENRFKYLDQDILNVICEGRVCFIEQKWNVITYYKILSHSRQDLIKYADDKLKKEYLEARKLPSIIHYSGSIKPWNDKKCDYFIEYLEVAILLDPFYEEKIIQRQNTFVHEIKKILKFSKLAMFLFPLHSNRREFLKGVRIVNLILKK